MTRRSGSMHTSEAGFTLLELLISMTLLGLLMVVVLGGLRFGARAWERNEAHTTATDDVRQAQALLRREISRAYPLFLMDQAHLENRHVDFDGSEESMSFLAPAPGALAEAGRARITLTRAAHNGKTALVFSAVQELASDNRPYSEVLVKGLRSLDFSYFGADVPKEAPSWRTSWSNEKALPQLVRVHAVFPDGDARTWPEFVVAPRVSVDVNCVYDALTRYCQGRR
jgi:general secretion pathway protein J